MSTTATKFSQSLNTNVFNLLNNLAKEENKTRADLLEEAIMLLEKQKRIEKLKKFYFENMKDKKPFLNKDFKPNKMKRINIEL